MAVDAIILLLDDGWMISFGIELGGELQDIARAVLYTVPTSLAAIFQDMNDTC